MSSTILLLLITSLFASLVSPTCTGADLTVRALNGRCNNLANPELGTPETIYYRSREGVAYNDTSPPFETAILEGRPRVRDVSLGILGKPQNPRTQKTAKRLSLLHTFFGQFVMHDITQTAELDTPNDPLREDTLDTLILRDDDPFLFLRTLFDSPPKTRCFIVSFIFILCEKRLKLSLSRFSPNLLAFPPFSRKTGLGPFPTPVGISRSRTQIVDDVREIINEQTHFLDLSTIYWHNKTYQDAFRTNVGGEMIVEDHEIVSAYNPDNPTIGTENPERRKLFGTLPNIDTTQTPNGRGQHGDDPRETVFASGDERSSSVQGLTSIHHVFYLEHNRIAKELQSQNPSWTDEEVFQKARAINTAQYQHIVYNEWLPLLFGDYQIARYLGRWRGYNPSVDPRVSALVSGVASRFGITEVLDLTPTYDKCGNPDITLGWGGVLIQGTSNGGPVFPLRITCAAGSFDNVLRAIIYTPIEQIDHMVSDILRNFNIPAQTSVGVDVVSLFMARARDNGIADFETVYSSWNPLEPGTTSLYDFCNSTPLSAVDDVECFESWLEQFSDVPDLAANTRDVYQKLTALDPWFAFLAEEKEIGSAMGRTLSKVLLDQFRRLRDGDRFWYENLPSLGNMPGINEPGLTQAELDQVRQITMNTILERITDGSVPEEAFIAPLSGDNSCATVPSIRILSGATVLKEALFNGNIINVTDVQTPTVTIEASTVGPVGSVTFDISGVGSPQSINVNLPASVTLPLNSNPICDSQNDEVDLTIVATPFSQQNGAGDSGFPLVTIITIVGNSQC